MTVTYRSSGSELTNNQIDSNFKTVGWRSYVPTANIASANSLTLVAEYNYFKVSGTITIQGIATSGLEVGYMCRLEFISDNGTIEHTASTFILPNGEDITWKAGDVATFVLYTTGSWKCVDYQSYTVSVKEYKKLDGLDTRNLLMNGNFDIWQRGTSFTADPATPDNSDDVYTADRFIFLSEAADGADIAQEGSVKPYGSFFSMSITQATANAQTAIVQILEGKDTIPLRGKDVVFSYQARTATLSSIATLRCGIIEWTGTTDSVTSDVIGTWASGGTDPTLATNWAYINTPANNTLSTSFQEFSTTATVGVSATNLAIIVWVDTGTITATANDIYYLAQFKLEKGKVATGFSRAGATIEDELSMCQRYFEKSYNISTAPGTSPASAGKSYQTTGTPSTNTIIHTTKFATAKRTTPTITLYDDAGTSGKVSYDSTNDEEGTAGNIGVGSFTVTTDAVTSKRELEYHWTADAEL